MNYDASPSSTSGIFLVPFERAIGANRETQKQFKYVRKMAMFPSAMSGRGVGNMQTSYYTPREPATNMSPFYRDLREARALKSGLAEPIGQKVLSSLSRDIVEILNDPQANDEQKASDYMHAIKRYLTFRDKLYNQTPVGQTIIGAKTTPTTDFQVVSPEDRYAGTKPRPTPTPRRRLFVPGSADAAVPAASAPARAPGGPAAAAAAGSVRDVDSSLLTDSEDDDDMFGEVFDDAPAAADVPMETARGEPSPVGGSRASIPIDAIVKTMPTRLRLKAASLLTNILAKTDQRILNWTRNNELVIRGRTIPGSNFTELVSNTLRVDKKKPTTGSRDFLNVLLDAGLITKSQLKKIMGSKSPSTSPEQVGITSAATGRGFINHSLGAIKKWNKLF
jgi:hypothetical protein